MGGGWDLNEGLSITPQSFGNWRRLVHVNKPTSFTLSAKMSLGRLAKFNHDVNQSSSGDCPNRFIALVGAEALGH